MATQYKAIIELYTSCPFDLSYQHTLEPMPIQNKINWLENNCYYNKDIDRYEQLMQIKIDTATGRGTVKLECPDSKAPYYNYAYVNNLRGATYLCFITGCRYINDASQPSEALQRSVYEFDLQIDLLMTNLVSPSQLKPCIVARQHSESDELFENLEYEEIGNFDETSKQLYQYTFTNQFKIAVCIATNKYVLTSGAPLWCGGVPNAYPVILFDYNEQGVLDLYKLMVASAKWNAQSGSEFSNVNNVVACYVLPTDGLVMDEVSFTWEDADGVSHRNPIVSRIERQTINITPTFNDIDGYVPKNKKLFSGQFYKLRINFCGGDLQDFLFEDFVNPESINFYYDATANYPVQNTLTPGQYKNQGANYDYSMQCANTPQVGTLSNAFAYWSASGAKGSFQQSSFDKLLMAGVTTASTVALTAATGGAAAPIALAAGANIAGALLSTADEYDSKRRDTTNPRAGQQENGSVLVRLGLYYVIFKAVFPRRNFLVDMDDYFTRFGYAQNKFLIPNPIARPYYTYLKLKGSSYINLVASGVSAGSANAAEMTQINSILNRGVTFWKRSITKDNIFKYDELDNSPS